MYSERFEDLLKGQWNLFSRLLYHYVKTTKKSYYTVLPIECIRIYKLLYCKVIYLSMLWIEVET
jgi:hypothetical protein